MWGREVDGIVLTFHLAGINNQNFLMRDDQTGSYWQQVSGIAIAGPLKGKALRLIPADEVTFGLYKTEQPVGEILKGVEEDEKNYSPIDWEKQFEKMPVVTPRPGEGFESKDVMLALTAFGQDKAYPLATVLAERLIKDRVANENIILAVGPDNDTVRAFRTPPTDFYRTTDPGALLVDAATGSKWNFQGCATEGTEKGHCLEPLPLTRNYWFDWRSYHPDAPVYRTPTSQRSTR